ncbi:MAG: 4Fe-4S dicluster domain-containing protein [Candidatus Ozemobacteraceae bacterium]
MPKVLRVVQREQCIGCLSCMYSCSRSWFSALTIEKAALRVRNYAGVEGAFSIRACYGCLEPDCARACPTNALADRPGGGVILNPAACVNCGACVKACVPKAMQWDVETKRPIPCRHCGICVGFCPNGVLAMQDVPGAADKPTSPEEPTESAADKPADNAVGKAACNAVDKPKDNSVQKPGDNPVNSASPKPSPSA